VCDENEYHDVLCIAGETVQNCKDDERVPDPYENPAAMPLKDTRLGPVWTWANAEGSNRTTADFQFATEEQYQEAEFPSIHDERYGQSPVFASEQPPGDPDPYCNSNNGTTSVFELTARNKCARRLVRPVFIWGSEGQYMVKVRADRIGTYFLDVTYRGADPIWIDGVLNTGTTIMGAPYAMVVTPGPAKAEWSTAYGDGLLNTTVGEYGYFYVTARDRFGNRVSVGGSEVRVVMAIGRARAECTSPESYDDDGGILFTNANSICTGQCLTSETIVNPTAAQRADPSYYLDWVTYCTIRDSNTGASRTTMLRDFVERTVIKGLRVSWEVR
jgi:hypothetical protein